MMHHPLAHREGVDRIDGEVVHRLRGLDDDDAVYGAVLPIK